MCIVCQNETKIVNSKVILDKDFLNNYRDSHHKMKLLLKLSFKLILKLSLKLLLKGQSSEIFDCQFSSSFKPA